MRKQLCCDTSSTSDCQRIERQQHICCGRRSSVIDCPRPLSSGPCPCLLASNSECKEDTDQILYPIPGVEFQIHIHYRCRIPQVRWRMIRGCFLGWIILSKYPDSLEFCLWNSVTLRLLHLPRLMMKSSFGDDDDDQLKLNNDILSCCLSSPCSNPDYVLLFIRNVKAYVEDKIISLSSLSCPDLPPLLWPNYCSRLVDDHEASKCRTDTKEEQGNEEVEEEIVVNGGQQLGEEMKATTEGHLCNIPSHIVELIAEYCLAVDYLNFRATSKLCRLAAPLRKWSTTTPSSRLQVHSLVSPWLMVLDKGQGLITFTDPKFGEKYFMTTIPESIGDAKIYSSLHGWLLIFRGGLSCLVFFNPFTRAIIELPAFSRVLHSDDLSSCGFSAPPTSTDCVVVALIPEYVLITSVGDPGWYQICFTVDAKLLFPTFCNQAFYVICQDGMVEMIIKNGDHYHNFHVVEPIRTSCDAYVRRFLVKCDNDVLSIVVGRLGKWVEVVKLNQSTLEWEKVDSLGKHMIYVCATTSFSVVAKIPGMENKIYFPRFRDGNAVFYSLDTRKYHTFKDKEEGFTDFVPTREQLSSVWIDPSPICEQLLDKWLV